MAVFASDTELGSSEVSYKALCIALHRGWISGSLAREDVSWLMRSYVMPLGSSHDNEDARVSETQALAHGIAEWARRRGKADLSRDLQAIGEGRRLVLYPVAVEEALRDMRQATLWRLSRSHARRRRQTARIPFSPPCAEEWTGSGGVSFGEWRVISWTDKERREAVFSQYENAKGKMFGTMSAAHYSFIPCVPYCIGTDVLVVGVGHGAVARLCLEAGARAVFGLDLSSTLPLEGHNFRWYKPSMVQESEDRDKYVQLPESFLTSGDWLDARVSSLVLTQTPPSSVIILDMQAENVPPSWRYLTPLIAASWAGPVFYRTYCTPFEAELLLSDMRAGGGRAEAHVTSVLTDATLPHAFLFYVGALPSLPARVHSSDVHLLPSHLPPCDLSFMGGGREYLWGEAIFNICSVGANMQPEDVTRAVNDVIVASYGDYLSRPSYTQWTLLLHAAVACRFVAGTEEERLRTLGALLHGQTLEIRVSHLVLPVVPSSMLVRHLSKTAARLIAPGG